MPGAKKMLISNYPAGLFYHLRMGKKNQQKYYQNQKRALKSSQELKDSRVFKNTSSQVTPQSISFSPLFLAQDSLKTNQQYF
jgi:hypothetical protein